MTLEPDEKKGAEQWVPVLLAGGTIVLLLLVANVQLWRVAEKDEQSAVTPLPSLPETTERRGGPLLRDLDRTIGELETQFEQFDVAIPPIDGLSGQLDDLTNQSADLVPGLRALSGVEGQLDRISRATPQLVSIPDQLEHLDGQIQDTERLGDRLDALNRQIKSAGAVRSDVRELNGRTSGLLDTADVLDNKASGLLDSASGLESTVAGLGSEFDVLNDRLDELDSNVGELDGTLLAFEQAIEVTNGQLQVLVEFICAQGAEAPEACSAVGTE